MPQIKKKGAIFPIFADSPSPPRATASGANSIARPASPTRLGAGRKISLAPTASVKVRSETATAAGRKALSQKSTAQISLGGLRNGQTVLGKGKAADGKTSKGDPSKSVAIDKPSAPLKTVASTSAPPPPAHRGHVRSATESSVYAGRPALRKKPAPSGTFGVFSDESACDPAQAPRRAEVKPSPVRLAAPMALSTADKENQPPALETPAPILSGRCASAGVAGPADVFVRPGATTSGGVLDLEALGNALMGSTAMPQREIERTRQNASMTLGYGRGRRASRPLQAALSAVAAPTDAEATEILEDEEDEQALDPSLLPPFSMGTPARRTAHSRTSSTQSIQESPSKWPAAVLSTSTATPLKRHRAPRTRASPVSSDVVGLGFGFDGAAASGGLDMRFAPDAVLGDVSDVYGVDRSAEPSGFRRAPVARWQQTHAQKDSWSGAWGADVASYPSARRP